jgi:hypothetical protein
MSRIRELVLDMVTSLIAEANDLMSPAKLRA